MIMEERNYSEEIDILKEKIGTLCHTVEMDIRLELRQTKIDQKSIIKLLKTINKRMIKCQKQQKRKK